MAQVAVPLLAFLKNTTKKGCDSSLEAAAKTRIFQGFLLRFDDLQGLNRSFCFDAEQVEAGLEFFGRQGVLVLASRELLVQDRLACQVV